MVEVQCEQCGKIFNKKGIYVRRYKHHFCSKQCYNLFRRKKGYPNKNGTKDVSTQNKLKKLAELRRKKGGTVRKSVSDVDVS